ncbi:MAG: ribosome small subunit-dependent GTPase A [Roseovarius sp.]|uniref:ribosome small subunit-dependent GTPase A n=1 Tax=Roseovarius sp. TaxID=1486281 RepID=UPI001B7616B5|nr:ribosome small subunit-dependent GTPase A [Roseovarius sp.]MBQ0748851.1 ribosome small subunit-dependent GTPase A [Roseovarius sp.]MBQ0809176.1 ribosome small subunit-dependent GTPase A [Roseovarius sp.]
MSSDQTAVSLAALGWMAFFSEQLEADEAGLAPMRIASVHRDRVSAMSEHGPVRLTLSAQSYTTDIAVGDWVLVDPETRLLVRRLNRRTLLQRKTEGSRPTQLIAANVDTLLIVTSCNDDFNPARLERYLALVNESGATPVIVLTKIDQTADAAPYLQQAEALQQGLDVVMLNATDPEAALTLAPWCGPGQTVALVGSSGVGKSTLLNTLSHKSSDDAQPTGPIREADAKGRHTTTSRSLHAIAGGGWVIDTPGMRTLHVSDATAGLNTLFAEIVELALRCRFRDCTHDHEPGCAVQGAAADGTLDPARLARWRKLTEENQTNTPIQTGPRGNKITRSPGKRR